MYPSSVHSSSQSSGGENIMLFNVFHMRWGFMSNSECAHSIPFLFIFIVFFFLLCSVLSCCRCQFPSLFFSTPVSPLSFSYICTYVSTQPQLLSNSKVSSPWLKGGARSGASFHDLDQHVSAYSPFFYRIIHILLHNNILLSYSLRSCSHLYSTALLERFGFGSFVWFVLDPIMRST